MISRDCKRLEKGYSVDPFVVVISDGSVDLLPHLRIGKGGLRNRANTRRYY